jgi:hypothetical protein
MILVLGRLMPSESKQQGARHLRMDGDGGVRPAVELGCLRDAGGGASTGPLPYLAPNQVQSCWQLPMLESTVGPCHFVVAALISRAPHCRHILPLPACVNVCACVCVRERERERERESERERERENPRTTVSSARPRTDPHSPDQHANSRTHTPDAKHTHWEDCRQGHRIFSLSKLPPYWQERGGHDSASVAEARQQWRRHKSGAEL